MASELEQLRLEADQLKNQIRVINLLLCILLLHFTKCEYGTVNFWGARVLHYADPAGYLVTMWMGIGKFFL